MNIFAELHRSITVASRIERKILAGIFVFGFVLIGPVSVVAQQLMPQPFIDPPKLAEEGQTTTVLSVKPTGDATECWATGTVKHDGNLVRLNWALELKPNQIRNPGNPSGYMDHVSLRSFGGCLTGPVIEAKPGNTLRIVLTNLLEPNDPSCASNPGCFNTLNMHFHGLHVSPTGNSDNVLINIAPHTKYEYEVNIPEDHPSGTFWYHPHRHESTAIGVASGASGAIIIRGDRPYLGSAPGDIDTIHPDYTGRVTVPVLWDKERGTIVNNESSEIIRMLNSAFDGIGAKDGDLYPEDLRQQIDALNARIYDTVNNGVYKAGFATTQTAYEEAVRPLFETLDWVEHRLRGSRYLCGECLTEADVRLFTTLIRFDPVYFGHFKCNVRRIADYPALAAYTGNLYRMSGVADTVDFHHIKHHYYESHRSINPTGIVPVGPEMDFLNIKGTAGSGG